MTKSFYAVDEEKPTDEWNLGPLVSAWVCGARGVGTKRRAR
jgi:hypothetical protein